MSNSGTRLLVSELLSPGSCHRIVDSERAWLRMMAERTGYNRIETRRIDMILEASERRQKKTDVEKLMKTVWKYELKPADTVELELPAGAKPLSVGEQDGHMMLWVVVDPNAPTTTKRRFRFAGTGHPIERVMAPWTFIGTVQFKNGLVFHVWETD